MPVFNTTRSVTSIHYHTYIGVIKRKKTRKKGPMDDDDDNNNNNLVRTAVLGASIKDKHQVMEPSSRPEFKSGRKSGKADALFPADGGHTRTYIYGCIRGMSPPSLLS